MIKILTAKNKFRFLLRKNKSLYKLENWKTVHMQIQNQLTIKFKLELLHFKKVKFSFYRNVKNLVKRDHLRVKLIADDSTIYYIFISLKKYWF